MGYYNSSKAYRIYFPGFKKIDISRDVTFDEDSAYNKSRKRPRGVKYEVNQKINLEGYVDSDCIGSAIDRKNT